MPAAAPVAAAEPVAFLLPMPGRAPRYLLAALVFALGLEVWLSGSPLGLAVVLLGHVPLWVRRQTGSPGGATPAHEEMWAPVEDGWLERVVLLERRSLLRDLGPWDATRWLGVLTLLLTASAVLVLVAWLSREAGPDAAHRVAIAAAALLAPIWLSGAGSSWQPSELLVKGAALDRARRTAARLAPGEYEAVPQLAHRRARRRLYPVDARLLLRPAGGDPGGFLGISVQVALHSIDGRDLPYLFCVLLGEEGFAWPGADLQFGPGEGRPTVFELGNDAGVDFLVVRQHVDGQGGWTTETRDVERLVAAALEVSAQAREANSVDET